ncbi:poly(beta-D-mannuronate) lyase [Bryocella elongata]|uniref:Poly(Beta-D-mannuronate) lyase n=1 Tax=Bryocella elongata TaxID=863522 RepID=A0A1H5WZH0_9BACT|nr:alginate lyase family protein [Bryocella elongata]SEG04954.1 poly(beta-D-mannuronate) lyase [Bryocella elongata]
MLKAPFLVALALVPALASAQHVTSTTASVIGVPSRIALLRSTSDPLQRSAIQGLKSCVATAPITPPSGPMQIPHHYLSGSHGPTNPEEKKQTEVYGAFERRTTAGMNQYLATGSHAEAQCALDQMDAWARANTLMDYDPHVNQNSQSWFQVEWTLSSLGTTLSVLVNDQALDPAKLARVEKWLNASAHRMIGFEGPKDINNHHDWRALAAISIGVVTKDNSLFDFGVTAYKDAVAQIDKNGAFPLEMARHERAIHYQSFALQPLVMIAEFAEHQHIDLYAYAKNGRTLRDAVRFLGHAMDDPTIVKSYTSDAQMIDFAGSDFAPFVFYAARFGNDDLGNTITNGLKEPVFETRIGGSTTVMAAK